MERFRKLWATYDFSFKKINKDEVTEEDIKDAMAEKEERIKAAEEARLEAERKAAEGEGGEGEGEGEAQPEDEWYIMLS